jgi:hypothetical protein
MSQRESLRRKICRFVFVQAWKIYRRSFISSFADALRLAWKLIRCKAHFKYSKVKGVCFGKNQRTLRGIARFQEDDISIGFMREYHNGFDPYAIKILIKLKSIPILLHIGYIDKKLSSVLSPLIDEGRELVGLIEAITGLNRENYKLGLNYKFVLL